MRVPSNAEIDRLGDRLREQPEGAPLSETDLRLLSSFRRSFAQAYERVIADMKQHIHGQLSPKGRPEKTNESIIAKLKRQPGLRLTQIQGIAGCRILTADQYAQDVFAAKVSAYWPTAKVDDRRATPSSGYRAWHAVLAVKAGGEPARCVEVQVRTILQHRWADCSQKLADQIDPGIKYGAGPSQVQRALLAIAEEVREFEDSERAQRMMMKEVAGRQAMIVPGLGAWRERWVEMMGRERSRLSDRIASLESELARLPRRG